MKMKVSVDMQITSEAGDAFRIPRGPLLAVESARLIVRDGHAVVTGWIEVPDSAGETLQERIASGAAEPISDRERSQLQEMRDVLTRRFGRSPR